MAAICRKPLRRNFSGFQFGMDDWGNWLLNFCVFLSWRVQLLFLAEWLKSPAATPAYEKSGQFQPVTWVIYPITMSSRWVDSAENPERQIFFLLCHLSTPLLSGSFHTASRGVRRQGSHFFSSSSKRFSNLATLSSKTLLLPFPKRNLIPVRLAKIRYAKPIQIAHVISLSGFIFFIRFCLLFGDCRLTIQIQQRRDTPTGKWLRKLNDRCVTQTVHKLKGQSALAPARC